jgi:8-oxo-dGTP pyrophosphatase MutT (NUDIX family)
MAEGRPLFLLIRDSYDNWGFPKGHVERDEAPERAALREVEEETGLGGLVLRDAIETIDWYFRFRKRLIHKVCHFYLMQSERSETRPQLEEGITECSWLPLGEALERISYANARGVLERAAGMVGGERGAESGELQGSGGRVQGSGTTSGERSRTGGSS